MITPNLASRPFLNTRLVWVMAVAAGVVALLFIVLNVRFFLVTNRTLGDELTRRDALEEQYEDLDTEARDEIALLSKVPWRSLKSRVDATNLVLREQAFSWLRMLDDIERVMPYDVRLARITPTMNPDGVLLNFDVVARNRDAMLDFIDNLVEDPRFEDPVLATEETPEESDSGTYVLKMRVVYRATGEAP